MLFPIENKGVKEEPSSSILLMNGKEPFKEEEDSLYCSLRIGDNSISPEMNFESSRAYEEMM
jgi:hypothetical protein